ncbi:hypothetical protein HK099_002092 [Clydaea vesicula]|uniref:Uncharacterized protein n=1 Tax=Clydaea vesicula TaxID=447962 RepID=A0AAD5U366_9FUNG|nr:hypothetical protein HK099_002092 [Clydaea vesicula]
MAGFEQKNPYVATVDLSERYGGLEKKEVKISNLSTEQLVLLKRDGKLNSETISMLESDGKLPLEDGSFIKKKKIEVNSGGINKNSVDIDEWIRDSPGLKKRDKKNKKNEIH